MLLPMIEVQVNTAEQLITLRYSQRVDVGDMKRCVQEIKAALVDMQPGFRMLNDLSNLDTMEMGYVEHIVGTMKLCNERQIGTVVRVIPDPTKDIGFNIMSRFHYSPEVKLRIYENLDDAVRVVINSMLFSKSAAADDHVLPHTNPHGRLQHRVYHYRGEKFGVIVLHQFPAPFSASPPPPTAPAIHKGYLLNFFGSHSPKLASAWLGGRMREGKSLRPQIAQCVGAEVPRRVCGQVPAGGDERASGRGAAGGVPGDRAAL